MRLAATVLLYVQVVLLGLTSPVASGRGPHRDQLLDPIFPHVHLDAPSVPPASITRGTPARPLWPPTASVPSRASWPVWGAGAGADSVGYGEALAPTTRWPRYGPVAPPRRLVPTDADSPDPRQEPPPDPPPVLTA